MPDDRPPNDPDAVQPIWDYTRQAQRQANESPYGTAGGGPYGSYLNRHIIGRDSRILGGISMVAGYPICIVVSEEDWHLPAVYVELETRLADKGIRRIPDLLAEVHALVREKLRYVDGLNKQIRREKDVTGRPVKLPLAFYVDRGEGVCWQQGLLAAYLIEKLIDNGCVGGSISTDRNMKRDVLAEWTERKDDLVGHQWARYADPNGIVYIIDPAQNYCGPLSNVTTVRGLWRHYFRPEDVLAPVPIPPVVQPPTPPAPEPKPTPRPLLDPLDYTLIAAGLLWFLWLHL